MMISAPHDPEQEHPDIQQAEQPSFPAAEELRAHVLVVEDDAPMARMIAATLATLYRVTTTSDGREGLEQALALHPDLMLCDVSMPRMSGEQLRIQLLRAGVQDYLLKPFHHEELRVRVANLLMMRQVRQVLQREVAVSVTISPLPDHQGRIIGSSTIAHDITERKRAEDALRQSRDELVASNAALEEANLVRSQFLATMSHELRTPLTSIIGFSEMLLDDAREAGWDLQQQNSLERILANSGHLLGLINDVLDLSKMEAGRMVLDARQVDPRVLLSEVAAEIGSLAIKRNLFLKTEVEEGLGSLETNPAKLQQILLNLLSNALKFTELGGVMLSARRVLLSDEKTEGIAFAVQDSGIGIPPELQERVFEAFS